LNNGWRRKNKDTKNKNAKREIKMADPKTRKDIEDEKALAKENIALLQTATDEMRKQSDLQKEQAKLTVENHNSNMELVKIAKDKGDFDAAREIELRSIGDVVASQAQVALATLSDAQKDWMLNDSQSKVVLTL
jgi:DNA-directed RNA polymerase beta subunit